ncbi:NUDIX hydrolase [Streptomyces sp. NPDC051985]|uniref:NUDIX hydrolase n=1 Tax=Streptomyces sp. NPDC051985 TaxID=3155807 RepID=UPI00342485E8
MTEESAEESPNWFNDPPRRRVGTLALILRGSQLMLVNRPDKITVAQWGLPGGSAGPDEHPRRALSRTLDERLGLRVTPGRWLAVDYVPATPGKHAEGTNWVYEVQLPGHIEPVINENSGFGDVRWVEIAAVGELAVDHALRRIEQSLRAAGTGQTAELYVGIPVRDIGPGTVPVS